MDLGNQQWSKKRISEEREREKLDYRGQLVKRLLCHAKKFLFLTHW